MAQRLIKSVADLLQKLIYRDIVDVHAQCQCVDEHTHRVCYFQIRTATADGAQIHLTVVGVARHHVCRGGKEEVGGCDFLPAAERGSLFVIGFAHRFADNSLPVGLRHIRWYLTCSLTSLQLLSEKRL